MPTLCPTSVWPPRTSTTTPQPTTPASPSPWRAPRRSTTARSPPTTPGRGLPQRRPGQGPGASRWRRPRPTGRSVRHRGTPSWSTPPASGPTTSAPSTRAPTRTRSGRPRASTSPCRGQGAATTSPSSCPCPRTGARCSWCRGCGRRRVPHLHRHHRHRLRRPARRPAVHARGHRVPADAINMPCASPHGPPTSSARGPGCGRWSRRPARSAPPTCPGATRCSPRRAGWSRSPAASSRPTGRWPPTPSTLVVQELGAACPRTAPSAAAPRRLRLDRRADGLGVAGDARPPGRPLRQRGDRDRRPGPRRPRLAGPWSPAPLPAGRGGLRGPRRDGPLARRRAGPPHPGPALARDASLAAAARRGRLLGAELGWTADEAARQVAAYRALIEAERAAPGLAETEPAALEVAR